jgi:hypothetical protein
MSFKIFRIEELDNKNFFYQSSKKINFNNKKVVFIPTAYKYNESILPILFQVPSIKLNDSYKKDSLLLPINPVNSNKTTILKNFFNNLDEKLIQDFKLNGKKWCKEILQNLKNIEYKALVNVIEDDESVYDNGVLNLQLEDINTTLFNKNKNQTSVKVYNEKKELVDEENYKDVLQKGNIIQCILELRGLVITYSDNPDESNEIFPYIKTHQVRYYEEKLLDVTLENYSFLESEIEPSTKNNANKNLKEVNNDQDDLSSSEESEDSMESEKSEESLQSEEKEELVEEDSDKELYKDKNGQYVLNDYSSDSSSSTSSDSDSEILKKIAKDISSEEESPKPKPKRKYTKRNTKN